MAQMQQLAESMLAAAATVLGRLVEGPAQAGPAVRRDREGSIKIDDERLVTLAQIPSLGICVVAGFTKADLSRVVAMMLGGAEEAGEMGAMQLSIVSETVSQIAAAMAEQLAKDVGAGVEGIHAELCGDATNVPPPPFVSFEGTVQVGDALACEVVVDFDGIAQSKLAGPAAEPPQSSAAPDTPQPAQAPSPAGPTASARRVTFTPMTPTPLRSPHPGQANLDLVHDVPLQISAVLGRTALTLRDVVSLQTGSVFELDKLSTDPIDLYVNNILIARGEVVVVDDKFAIKISELNPNVG